MWDLLLYMAIAFLAAAIGAMGIGGGTVLLIYLSAFCAMGQRQAQGINLLFFIPVALVALLLHTKSKLIDWKVTLFTAVSGAAGAYLGFLLSSAFDEPMLKKAFAVFLLLIGIKEILSRRPAEDGVKT